MAQFYGQSPPPGGDAYNSQNLQFYPSNYGNNPVSGHSTPAQAQYGRASYGNAANQAPAYAGVGGPSGFMSAAPAFGGQGISGRMGEQGGLRTGWLAAFGTEGYDGEPPLLEELGVNFGHIKIKVRRPQVSRSMVSNDVVPPDVNSLEPPRSRGSAYHGR